MERSRVSKRKKKTFNIRFVLANLIIVLLISGIVFVLLFDGQSSKADEKNNKQDSNNQTINLDEESDKKTDNNKVEDTESEIIKNDEQDKTKTKELEVYNKTDDGEDVDSTTYDIDKKEAELTETNTVSVYLLKGYSSKEDAEDTIITLDSNSKIFARIEKVSNEFDVNGFLNELYSTVNAFTLVQEKNPAHLPNNDLQNASTYVLISHASTEPISNISHIFNEIDGQLYKYEIHTFATDNEEEILSEFLSMLSTAH